MLIKLANLSTLQVSESICSLMSHNSPPGQEMLHVYRVFTSMDSDGDGVLTKEDFYHELDLMLMAN